MSSGLALDASFWTVHDPKLSVGRSLDLPICVNFGCPSECELVTDRAIQAWYHFTLHGMTPREGHMAIYIRRREFISTLWGGAVANHSDG